MIIVTGAAGFIGSNLVTALNARGVSEILAVDNLQDGSKFRNLADLRIADYLDQDDLLARVRQEHEIAHRVHAVFHQGACSVTTEWDGRYMMRNNFEYSKALLHWCLDRRIPFIYASSASVYGLGPQYREDPACEHPINVYAYSKFLFDQYVRRIVKHRSQIVGLRYFNVYGPREQHKGGMASVAFHFDRQIRETGECRLFEGSDGYAAGEQRRDFIDVADAVAVNLWFLDHRDKSGIFNCGTGRSQSFNDVARAVITWHGRGKVVYVPFPDKLKGSYQSYTQADLAQLRATGCDVNFATVEQGVKRYLDLLHAKPNG